MASSHPLPRRAAGLLAAGVLTIAACRGSDDPSRSDDAGETPAADTATDTTESTPSDDAMAPAPDDTATPATADERSDPLTDSTDAPAAAGAAAVRGVLISLLSPSFGLYDVARGTGHYRELSIDGAGYSDREHQPILSGDTAYTLTYTPLAGQSYSHDVGVAAIERATGAGEQIAMLGVDRTDDESEDLTTYRLLGADETMVWVEAKPFAESDPAQIAFVAYDLADGQETARLTDVAQRESGEAGQCEVNVRNVAVDSTGSLLASAGEWPVRIDPGSGEVTPLLVSCLDAEEPTLLSEFGARDADAFMIPSIDLPLDQETVESVAGATRLTMSNGIFTEGDGELWWIFNQNVAAIVDGEGINVIVGGLVRFDLESQRISAVFPLGDATGEWLPSDGNVAQYASLSDMDLLYLADSLWVMDRREDRPLLRIAPTTGAITKIEIPAGEGFDAVEARLVMNDPEAVWLEVTRKVVTENADGERSSAGTKFVEQVDPVTEEIIVSIPENEILGV